MKKSLLITLCSLTCFSFGSISSNKATKGPYRCYYVFGIAYHKSLDKHMNFLSVPVCTDDYNSEVAEKYFIESVKYNYLAEMIDSKPIVYVFSNNEDANLSWEESKQKWGNVAAAADEKLYLM